MNLYGSNDISNLFFLLLISYKSKDLLRFQGVGHETPVKCKGLFSFVV